MPHRARIDSTDTSIDETNFFAKMGPSGGGGGANWGGLSQSGWGGSCEGSGCGQRGSFEGGFQERGTMGRGTMGRASIESAEGGEVRRVNDWHTRKFLVRYIEVYLIWLLLHGVIDFTHFGIRLVGFEGVASRPLEHLRPCPVAGQSVPVRVCRYGRFSCRATSSFYPRSCSCVGFSPSPRSNRRRSATLQPQYFCSQCPFLSCPLSCTMSASMSSPASNQTKSCHAFVRESTPTSLSEAMTRSYRRQLLRGC